MADNEIKEPVVLKTSSATDATKLASSIVSHYQKDKITLIIIRAIGAGAVNQSVKSVIIANKYFVRQGMVLMIIPAFNDIEEENVTAVELRLQYKQL